MSTAPDPGPGAAVLAEFAQLVASGATRAERDARLEQLKAGLVAIVQAAPGEPTP